LQAHGFVCDRQCVVEKAPALTLPLLDPLSGHEHKYDDVRGKGFFGQTRRERRAYPAVDL